MVSVINATRRDTSLENAQTQIPVEEAEVEEEGVWIANSPGLDRGGPSNLKDTWMEHVERSCEMSSFTESCIFSLAC